jgi:5-methylcytosine-specific restriction enzyme A
MVLPAGHVSLRLQHSYPGLPARYRANAEGLSVSRTVTEWIGKTDDEPVPDRVRVRVFDKFGGICQECGVKIVGKRWVCDHRKAIINGGANRESNLGPIHEACDKTIKTPNDVAEKARTYRKRKSALGVKRPRTITRWRKFDGTPVIASRER